MSGGEMAVHPTDHTGLEILSFGDCLRLLDSVTVGRIGFFANGEIVILPVNYLMDGQDVIFRTGIGSKLRMVGSKNLVGFEADAYDARTRSGWSVVVSGFTEAVKSDEEIRRLNDLGLQSWARAAEDVSTWIRMKDAPTWIRIRSTSITGRRTPGAAFGG
jgi:uncharacterized protein